MKVVKKILLCLCAGGFLGLVYLAVEAADAANAHARFESAFGFSVRGLTEDQKCQFQPDVNAFILYQAGTCSKETSPYKKADCLREYNRIVKIAKDIDFSVGTMPSHPHPQPDDPPNGPGGPQ